MGTLIAVLLAGCATSSQVINKVKLGMTKAEVIEIMGQPKSTRANREAEYLVYKLREGITKPFTTLGPVSIEEEYFVKLVDGRVESYGRVGDFDSTKPFETKHEINLNVKEK